MKRICIAALLTASILTGCGSVSSPDADVSRTEKTAAEKTVQESAADSSSAEDSSEEETSADETTESREETASFPDGLDDDGNGSDESSEGQFPGGLDDDGKGSDETHFSKESGFAPGIWWSFIRDNDSYYEFSTDGTGTQKWQSDGTEANFTYYMDNGDFVMSYSSGPERRAKTEERGDGAILTFEDDGHTEELVYMGNITFDEFTFFSDETIGELARAYYVKHSGGYEPAYCDVEYSTENNDRVVHLYDIVDDHSATANWYYIDRFTCKGKDFFEKEVDLTEIIDSMAQ